MHSGYWLLRCQLFVVIHSWVTLGEETGKFLAVSLLRRATAPGYQVCQTRESRSIESVPAAAEWSNGAVVLCRCRSDGGQGRSDKELLEAWKWTLPSQFRKSIPLTSQVMPSQQRPQSGRCRLDMRRRMSQVGLYSELRNTRIALRSAGGSGRIQ